MNHDDADPWFIYPALDRDLVRTRWFGSGKSVELVPAFLVVCNRAR
jgi:hypothetical protein